VISGASSDLARHHRP